MLVYIEVLMCLLPTMMATVAKGTHPKSTYKPETLPTIHENIKVMEVGVGFNSNTSPSIKAPHSTCGNIQSFIADPMHAANFCSNHDQCQPIDLMAIFCKIKCSTISLDALFATLVPKSNSDKEQTPNKNPMHANAPPGNYHAQ